MSSSLKVLGLLLILLLTLCGLFFQTQNPSWRDFMKQHHLSSSLAFSEYRCNDLMREREAPKDKNYHIFIYTLWHKIEHMCFRNQRDRYRNAYMWAQYPFKILKCYLENNKKSYKEQRSYSYIEFHCGLNGFVDSIEDIRLLYVISN